MAFFCSRFYNIYMIIENQVSIYDFVSAISEVVDLVCPELNRHHKKVAYIAHNIALEMGLPNVETQDIVLASMLHDIGAFTTEERIKNLEFESCDDGRGHHAFSGFRLLETFKPLSRAAELIRHHHTVYEESDCDIALGSRVIHLADRVSVMFDESREILEQIPSVAAKFSLRRDLFHPDVFAAFDRLTKLEYVWVEAFLPLSDCLMIKRMQFPKEIADLDTLRSFAKLIAQIIDFRSRFTATHSSGVAAVAHELAAISGFSERECRQMEIAGFLHDLGKLAVPDGILEKKGALSDIEFNLIRKHTYYTYAVLSKVKGLEDIAVWASYHHERQDGNGYPFHVKDGDFSKLARIMAVADIITALTEDRPYRSGMSREKAENILLSMAEDGGIDKNVVDLANKNFLRINNARVKAQKKARKEYDVFYGTQARA